MLLSTNFISQSVDSPKGSQLASHMRQAGIIPVTDETVVFNHCLVAFLVVKPWKSPNLPGKCRAAKPSFSGPQGGGFRAATILRNTVACCWLRWSLPINHETTDFSTNGWQKVVINQHALGSTLYHLWVGMFGNGVRVLILARSSFYWHSYVRSMKCLNKFGDQVSSDYLLLPDL